MTVVAEPKGCPTPGACSCPADNAAVADMLSIIDEIEKIRSGNNVNWMDILRLAVRSAPDEAKQIIRKINSDDNRISQLFEKLGK
jgi:hypothetical protein